MTREFIKTAAKNCDRPFGIDDSVWGLVAQMCVLDLNLRPSIISFVSTIRKLVYRLEMSYVLTKLKMKERLETQDMPTSRRQQAER